MPIATAQVVNQAGKKRRIFRNLSAHARSTTWDGPWRRAGNQSRKILQEGSLAELEPDT
jgi:hypothetical protein